MSIAVKIVVSFVDNKGKAATTEIKIPTGISLGNMIEFAQELASLIDPITNGRITSVSLAIGVDLSGLGLTGAAGSTADVEEKGVYQFRTSEGFNTTVAIPCHSDTDTVDGSDAIDTSDANIAAFIAAMTGGIVLTDTSTVQPCDAREDDIISIDWSRERFRSSGKRTG